MALIPKTSLSSDNFQAFIFYDNEWEEFVVKFFEAGPIVNNKPTLRHLGEDHDAHEDDYDAAIGTAKAALLSE